MAPLLHFKAGRSARRANSNYVDSQPERGLFSLENEDGLLHLKWANLTTPTEEPVDLILFPGDATVSKANGRVFVLSFSSSDQRTFFWFQDVSDAQDASRLRRINALIEDVDAPERADEAQDVEMSAGPADSTSRPLATSSQPPPAPAASTPAFASAPASSSADDQLRNILAQFTGQQAQPQIAPYTLNGILEPAPLTTFIGNLDQADIDELTSFLPSDIPHDRHTLIKVISSLEFKRSVASFDAGLRTGGLAPVVASLGLPQKAALGVEEYCSALREQGGSRQSGAGGMQVD